MSGKQHQFGKSNSFKVKVFHHHNQPSHKQPNKHSSNGSQNHTSERDNRNNVHLENGNVKRSFEDMEISQSNQNKRRKIEFVPPINPKNGFGSLLQISSSQPSSSLNGSPEFMHSKPNLVQLSTKNNDSRVGLFDPAIVNRYLSWHEVKRVGPGFYNEGNSCYLNSTLQCLLYIPALVQVLMQENDAALKNIPRDLHNQMKPISEIFATLVNDVWGESSAPKKSILPRGMVTTIRRVGKQFKPFRQEDAHEYLRQLLDTMHEEVLKANRLKFSDGKAAETTFISRIFGGYLCNTLTCSQCNYASQTHNHFLDLSLEIRQGIQSLDDAINHFIKPEYLSHGNEWNCDGCKRKVKANKQMTISEAPPVLAIQLKRFAMSHGLSFKSNNKITKHIQFPAHLSLPCTKSKQPVEYDLTGVVVHHGTTTQSGHYIAYVKASNGIWYEMNDSHVSQVSISRVLQSQAYLLFYSQKGNVTAASAPVAPLPAAASASEEATNSTTQNGKLPFTHLPKPTSNATICSDDSNEEGGEESSSEASEVESENADSIEDDEDFPPLYCSHIFKYRTPLQRFRRWYWSTRPNLYKERHLLRKFECYGLSRNTQMILRKYLLMRQHIAGKFGSEIEADSESNIESDSDSDRDLFVKSKKKEATNSTIARKVSEESEEDSSDSEDDDAQSSSHESDRSEHEMTEQDDNDDTPRVKTATMDDILDLSRRSRTLGGEGVWEVVSDKAKQKIEEISKQQRREDQIHKKQYRLSDWDQSLDAGHIRKVKEPKLPLQDNTGENNPFQRVTEQRRHDKRASLEAGEYQDFRGEVQKHQRKRGDEQRPRGSTGFKKHGQNNFNKDRSR